MSTTIPTIGYLYWVFSVTSKVDSDDGADVDDGAVDVLHEYSDDDDDDDP